MSAAPIVLVPGFWLGAWAWDAVVDTLRADGHDVVALTLPGREPDRTDRGSVTMSEQADAICAAIESAPSPVVLAVHSGSSQPGFEATARMPDRLAHMVYVDTAPGIGPIKPDFEDDELPVPSTDELAEDENLDGLPDEQLAALQSRGVPEPGSSLRQGPDLGDDDAYRDVPSTVIATGFSSDQYKAAVEEGYAWMAGLKELRNLSWIDLPTSHWPMWSRPDDLAEILARIATDAG